MSEIKIIQFNSCKQASIEEDELISRPDKHSRGELKCVCSPMRQCITWIHYFHYYYSEEMLTETARKCDVSSRNGSKTLQEEIDE